MKILFNIYPDTEPLFEKIGTCGMFIQCSFDGTISKRDFRTVEDLLELKTS